MHSIALHWSGAVSCVHSFSFQSKGWKHVPQKGSRTMPGTWQEATKKSFIPGSYWFTESEPLVPLPTPFMTLDKLLFFLWTSVSLSLKEVRLARSPLISNTSVLCARHGPKCFPSTYSFNPPNNPRKQPLSWSHFIETGNQSTERLSNFPKATQPVSGFKSC